jgi:hypothetical protein
MEVRTPSVNQDHFVETAKSSLSRQPDGDPARGSILIVPCCLGVAPSLNIVGLTN